MLPRDAESLSLSDQTDIEEEHGVLMCWRQLADVLPAVRESWRCTTERRRHTATVYFCRHAAASPLRVTVGPLLAHRSSTTRPPCHCRAQRSPAAPPSTHQSPTASLMAHRGNVRFFWHTVRVALQHFRTYMDDGNAANRLYLEAPTD